MNKVAICVPTVALLAGCVGTAFISEQDGDNIIVQAHHADQAQVRAEAERGCAVLGRTAEPVGTRCVNSSCGVQRFRFACRGSPAYRGSPSPLWLGMSVDDVTDHLYAKPRGSSAVVITRIYAEGPAQKAGLRVGDMIVSFNNIAVTDSLSLVNLKRAIATAQPIPIGVRREDQELRLVLTAESR